MQKLISDLLNLTKKTSSRYDLIGYLTCFTPIEIFHAAGFIPVRISSGESNSIQWSNDLKPFVCNHVREIGSRKEQEYYKNLKGVVLAYSCDAMCGLFNIWKERASGEEQFFLLISPPYDNNEHSHNYYHEHITRIFKEIEQKTGKILELSKLAQSVAVYNSFRKTMQTFFQKTKLEFSYSKLLQVSILAQKSEPDAAGRYIQEFLERHKDIEGKRRMNMKKRVLVLGTDIFDPAIIKLIEDSSAVIVADDLDIGENFFNRTIKTRGDILSNILSSYIDSFPRASRSNINSRIKYLSNLVKNSKADGTVFIMNKFCHPEFADFPIIAQALKAKEYLIQLIEWDGRVEEIGQLRTRIEAFVEMMS
jgi:benzoyl-CoA reductase/2-hydroxyglutaryl-CoA dehydratase subunit BcrC/BadD/HgdB